MKKYTSKIVKTIPYIIISILIGVTAVYASTTTSLTPSGSASNTMYSLTDLYNLASGTVVSENTGSIETTPSEVALSGKSLSDVYTAISTEIAKLSSGVIASGTTAFGIAGNVSAGVNLSNMYNGSCIVGRACPNGNELPGGTQAQGGVDDANYDTTGNLTQVPPVDRYETTWTTCNLGNNYCGTGDTGANAKDEATGLVWSYSLTGIGGSYWDTETDTAVLTVGCLPYGNCAYWNTDTYYSWDNSRADNDSKTAYELCSSHTGWYLPHQKQLMQSYIDGAYGNLETQGVDRSYWSATAYSSQIDSSWYVSLSRGDTRSYYKTTGFNVRCIRE